MRWPVLVDHYNLREQLIELSVKKGYSVAEIKSALDLAGITVSIKAIKEAINTDTAKSRKKVVVQKSANAKTSGQTESKSS